MDCGSGQSVGLLLPLLLLPLLPVPLVLLEEPDDVLSLAPAGLLVSDLLASDLLVSDLLVSEAEEAGALADDVEERESLIYQPLPLNTMPTG